MHKSLIVLLLLIGLQTPVFAAEEVKDSSDAPAEEIMFYSGSEVRPLEAEMSYEEKQQENNSDLEDIEEIREPVEIECNSPQLKKQVEDFIYENISQLSTNSTVEKRSRVLLVRNLQDFEEITEDEVDSKDSFTAASALAYLKINRRSSIDKICRSTGNRWNQFKNLYVIIYPYINYYKVVVANVMKSTESLDEATFIYEW